ncbi:glycosyltransferase [Citrifermentans pelophilum]|uniref:glycosyltransferase n=1 Tax=Geoanaerobacter pelophilus TaxID=60036 RepID=UPI001BDA0C08|nr:glycosyltransferase [Geoanaerobacter pelophilus]
MLFVQNPSMLLAFIACLYRLVSHNIVIVDRHTTFRINKEPKLSVDHFMFKFFHWFTIRFADLTMVTNKYLAELVENKGGIPFVLPDKLPEIKPTEQLQLKEGFNILLISSFGYDEPIDIVLQSMKMLEGENINLYVTGNYKKLGNAIVNGCKENVIFTGFLPEADYINMLFAVDAVMVLTTADHCMLCGCYEAISAGKPLLTSAKLVLLEYFDKAVFVNNTCDEIVSGIKQIIDNYPGCVDNTMLMRRSLGNKWMELYEQLNVTLEDIIKNENQ